MNLKREIAKALSAYLKEKVPALAGRIRTVTPDFNDKAMFPSLTIIPGTMKYMPNQEEELSIDEAVVGAGNTLAGLGSFEGSYELLLASTNPCEREDLEEQILSAFLICGSGRPGIVVLDIPNLVVQGIATTYTAKGSLSLEEETWVEEKVFSQKRFASLELMAFYDAFAMCTDTPTIEQLILALASDLDESSGLFAPMPFGLGELEGDGDNIITEDVQINEDGSITAL